MREAQLSQFQAAKSTKDTKRDLKYIYCLCDLRVLCGEITIGRIQGS